MKDTDVLIIGAGLTGLTLGYRLGRAGMNVVIAEREDRPGGVIRTYSHDGFTYEAGPNTGTLSTQELVALLDDLGSLCTPLEARTDAERRMILKESRWHDLPSGLFNAVSTPLFTMRDKFRILAEPFRPRGTNPDETVADLVKRRLGRSFLDYAVDPFISGIYAGDPSRLVTRYALPKLYRLEQEHGSFIRGTISRARQPKSEMEKRVTKKIFSAKGGLQAITDAIASTLPPGTLMTGCRIEVAEGSPYNFVARGKDSAGNDFSLRSRYLVTTSGAHTLPSILPFIDERELIPVTGLEYSGVAQVVAGYSNWQGDDIKAFGGLVPSIENREVLGILFPSSIFDNRAPSGGALMSVFMGGRRKPWVVAKSDSELIGSATGMIRETLSAGTEPSMVKVFRYPHAIPQYEVTTGRRLECIEKTEARFPGLKLAGNIRDGIGMADRVRQAAMIAQQIVNDRMLRQTL